MACAFSQSHKAHDALRTNAKRIVTKADAVCRSSLAGYGYILIGASEAFLQFDDARHIEHDGSRPGKFGYSVAERAGFFVISKSGDMIHLTAASACGKASVSLGIGECQLARTESPDVALVNLAVGIFLIYTPEIGVEAVYVRQLVLCIGKNSHLFEVGFRCSDIKMMLLCRPCRSPCKDERTAVGIGVELAVFGIRRRCRGERIRAVEHERINHNRVVDVSLSTLGLGYVSHNHRFALIYRKGCVR